MRCIRCKNVYLQVVVWRKVNTCRYTAERICNRCGGWACFGGAVLGAFQRTVARNPVVCDAVFGVEIVSVGLRRKVRFLEKTATDLGIGVLLVNREHCGFRVN